jgi:uncharacterized protein YgbK (DUF1537 family)
MDVEGLMRGAPAADRALDWIAGQSGSPLVYSSARPEDIAAANEPAVAQAVERALGEVARRAVAGGHARRLVVAGGETSGAVVRALGAIALRIGPEIAPGVPWTEALARDGRPICALALKSGNFGDAAFFSRALSGAAPE